VYCTTIFGECVESAVIQPAQSSLGRGTPPLARIKMTRELGDEGEDVIGMSMPCGGTMDGTREN